MKSLLLFFFVLIATQLRAQTIRVVEPVVNNFGTDNILIGSSAGAVNMTSQNSVVIGKHAGLILTTGSHNIMIGRSAGGFTQTGGFNVFMGYNSGFGNTVGSHNVFLGHRAGEGNNTGSMNVAIGSVTGFRNGTFGSIGTNNIMVGDSAGFKNFASNNVFIGGKSGHNNTTGLRNNFLGRSAGFLNTVGRDNIFLGSFAAYYNTIGSENIVIGNFAGQRNQQPGSMGSANVLMGDSTGYKNTGDRNVFLGKSVGFQNTAGSGNTYVGFGTDGLGNQGPTLQRATAIGHNAKVGVQDGMVLGDTSQVKVGIGTAFPNQRLTIRGNINFLAFDNSIQIQNRPLLQWDERENLALGLDVALNSDQKNTLILGNEGTKLGIGTHTPQAKVEINSGQAGNSGLVFSQLKNQQTDQKFLTVNQDGLVEIQDILVQAADPNSWADYVFEPSYRLLPLADLERFIHANRHLPNFPSSEQIAQAGIPLQEFLSLQTRKIEELTLYIIDLQKSNEELAALRQELNELRQIVLKK
ncbi:autotransporter outer membrane beta-barrel domain-containing protein [Arundinibacter roseus]|uniref:TMF family protein n=1 Tax=Arundinibacter roseus TaxID=2070510 RepID=A0A4R4KLA7_9BACT|nr:hypothetical protein [Arundinibacter roseus]TDB67361.1 hypothetical protein EZE20_05280 [Arundinibacter roseus]